MFELLPDLVELEGVVGHPVHPLLDPFLSEQGDVELYLEYLLSGLVADLDTRIEIRRVLQNISNKYLSIGRKMLPGILLTLVRKIT